MVKFKQFFFSITNNLNLIIMYLFEFYNFGSSFKKIKNYLLGFLLNLIAYYCRNNFTS
jgi:hypothetical protein